MWGELERLVGRVGRKEGLGYRQDHLDLSSPWVLPANKHCGMSGRDGSTPRSSPRGSFITEKMKAET